MNTEELRELAEAAKALGFVRIALEPAIVLAFAELWASCEMLDELWDLDDDAMTEDGQEEADEMFLCITKNIERLHIVLKNYEDPLLTARHAQGVNHDWNLRWLRKRLH